MRQRRLETGGPGSTGLIGWARQPVARGPRRSEQPRKVDEPADVVVNAVADGGAVQAVTAGPDEIRAGVSAGNTDIEVNTVDPSSRQPVVRVAALSAAMPAAAV